MVTWQFQSIQPLNETLPQFIEIIQREKNSDDIHLRTLTTNGTFFFLFFIVKYGSAIIIRPTQISS